MIKNWEKINIISSPPAVRYGQWRQVGMLRSAFRASQGVAKTASSDEAQYAEEYLQKAGWAMHGLDQRKLIHVFGDTLIHNTPGAVLIFVIMLHGWGGATFILLAHKG